MSDSLFATDRPTNRVLKRAQYEQFEFSLLEEDVLVRNESHADPAAHEYRVTLENGEPVSCECPADDHYEGPCKHRTAVAIRSQIGTVAADAQAVVDASPDSTNLLPAEQDGDDDLKEPGRPDDCECDAFNTSIDLACWPCYRAGFEDPAPDADDPS